MNIYDKGFNSEYAHMKTTDNPQTFESGEKFCLKAFQHTYTLNINNFMHTVKVTDIVYSAE